MNNPSNRIFLIKLISFFLFVIILDFSIGFVLKHFYFKQQSGFQYRTTYSMQKTEADVLIFGSSRASHHYNPEILSDKLKLSCYNVGRDGNHILYHTAVLKAILNRYTPKIIVLDVIKGELELRSDSYEKISTLLPYYDSHPEIRSIVELRSPYEKIKLLSKIYPYNSDIFSIAIGNTGFSKSRWNYVNGFLPWHKKMKCPVKIDTNYNEKKIDEVKVSYYESFIKECKRKGVKLYVVISPYYLISDITDKSVLICKEIAEKHEVKIFDFSQDPTFKLQCSLFGDITHLNVDGTDIFTRKVSEKILQDNDLTSLMVNANIK